MPFGKFLVKVSCGQ